MFKDISELANNIRNKTISESHADKDLAEAVAAEIQNELGTPGMAAEMKVLVGSKQEVNELEQLTEDWIQKTEGVSQRLEDHGFGVEKRKALFEKIRDNIKDRNRPNT